MKRCSWQSTVPRSASGTGPVTVCTIFSPALILPASPPGAPRPGPRVATYQHADVGVSPRSS